jgi:hypothetical protein
LGGCIHIGASVRMYSRMKTETGFAKKTERIGWRSSFLSIPEKE